MNKLILEGKEYILSDELIEKIKAEVEEQKKKENPFERILGKKYYYISGDGKIYSETESRKSLDNTLYAVGNYCCDIKTFNQRLFHETLNRLLWRHSIEHDGKIKTYGIDTLFLIDYSTRLHDFKVIWTQTMMTNGAVYFKKEETARKAIEEVIKPFLNEHPDFNYFRW